MNHTKFNAFAVFAFIFWITGSSVSAQVAAPAPAAPAPYQAPGYFPPPPPPPAMLGINMDTVYIPGLGGETGLRVTNVWPGYPAYGLIDPGDIITRVNGVRVRNIPEFRHAMAYAGPYVTLRLWNVRVGYIHDIAPIYLGGGFGPAAAMPAPAAPAAAPAAQPGAPAAISPTPPVAPGVAP